MAYPQIRGTPSPALTPSPLPLVPPLSFGHFVALLGVDDAPQRRPYEVAMNNAFDFANRLQQFRPGKAFEVTFIKHAPT